MESRSYARLRQSILSSWLKSSGKKDSFLRASGFAERERERERETDRPTDRQTGKKRGKGRKEERGERRKGARGGKGRKEEKGPRRERAGGGDGTSKLRRTLGPAWDGSLFLCSSPKRDSIGEGVFYFFIFTRAGVLRDRGGWLRARFDRWGQPRVIHKEIKEKEPGRSQDDAGRYCPAVTLRSLDVGGWFKNAA